MEDDKQRKDFKYGVGMYGGCFDMLHLGHLYTIERAASECKELWLVLSWSKTRDHVEWKHRLAHLKKAAECYPNVQVFGVEDSCATKALYNTGENWEIGAREIKSKIGKHIDVVYCSDEYDVENSPYKRCYPDSKLIFIDRSLYKCSSSEIRQDPFKHWDYIPTFVRPDFVKKILLVGHESTGKTTLCKALSSLFRTKCVLEYGREVCERAGGEKLMSSEDFQEIVFQHSLDIMRAAREANKLLFVDTDQLTTAIFSEQNKIAGWSSDFQLVGKLRSKFDLVLFMEPDVSFTQDGLRNELRNSFAERKRFSEVIKALYAQECCRDGVEMICIDGDYHTRLEKCRELIKEKWPSA